MYGTAIVTSLMAAVATSRIHPRRPPKHREPPSLKTVLAGFHYIWQKKLILGSISLDLFAVLLGGAVALLPVYASEILKLGPGDWACCAARPEWAQRRWRFCWRIGRYGGVRA